MGHIVMGKLETGRLAKGKKLIVMPNGSKVKVAQIDFEDNPIKVAVAGMNLKVSHFDQKLFDLYLWFFFRSDLKELKTTNNSKRVSYYVMLAKNVTKELFSMLALLFKNTNRLSRKSNLIKAAKLTGRYNSYRKISLVRVSQRLCISIRPLKKLKSNVYWASLIKRLKRWKSSLVQNF